MKTVGQYDHWWDVPVVVSGTPNPEAVRLIEESVREFEDSQFVRMERPCPTAGCDGEMWMLPNGRKCGCDTCMSVFSIERVEVG